MKNILQDILRTSESIREICATRIPDITIRKPSFGPGPASLPSLSIPNEAAITKQFTSRGIPKRIASRLAVSYCRRAGELSNHIHSVYLKMINQLETVGPSRPPVEAYKKAYESAFCRKLDQWIEKYLSITKEHAGLKLREIDSVNVNSIFSQVRFP